MGRVFIRQNLEAGLFSFRNNPLRSTLTITGIVVGIAAVVAVLSIGKGNQAKIEVEVEKMGPSLFWVEPQSSFSMSQVGTSMMLSVSRTAHNLTIRDAALIKKRCTLVKYVAPASSFFVQGTLDGKTVQLNVVATTPEYQRVKSLQLVEGRYICDMDMKELNNICVVEENPGLDLVSKDGHHLTINGTPFRVVGVIKKESAFLPTFTSAVVHVPLTVAQNDSYAGNSIQRIYCLADKTAGSSGVEQAKRQVEEVLTTSLRITNAGVTNENLPFQVLSSRDVFERAESMVKTATMVTAGIGMLSLFVGGIGIMNILLASVTERTREIGVRKTVGARKRDILLQFLFESIVLSLTGGVLGVLIGVFFGKPLGAMIGVPAVLSVDAILAGFSFSIATGMVFGVYPAWKAGRMSPVDALRYE
ncbi:MAG: ABC transporter permease [Bacteroidetes bacterium]|nr:ABC transporter permease [Bacteroidota bacterium]MCL5737779.1 ABC transporter permease [Bacteroidota bacterium]